MGPGWKDGQMACRTQAQLNHCVFHPYSVFWVPTTGPTPPNETADPKTVVGANEDQGVLTIWPTHLISDPKAERVSTIKPSLPTPDTSPEDHLGLMAAASDLFDIVSAYREPVSEMTPPSDRSIEEAFASSDPVEANTPISQASSTRDPGRDVEADVEDDLEGLFASDTPPRTPEMFGDSSQAFEMFGEQSNRRISGGNNAHLIDYGDVIMSSPTAQEERRASLREVLGASASDTIEEPEAAFVTEDDFNFFDSPPDEVAPDQEEAPNLAAEPAEPLHPVPTVVESPKNEHALQVTSPAIPPLDEIVLPNGAKTGDSTNLDKLNLPFGITSLEQPEAPTDRVASKEKDELAPAHSLPTPASSSTSNPEPHPRSADTRSLVPSAFEPLDLSHSGTTFTYSLPSPAPTPPNLNADLIQRLSSPKTTKKAYEYAAAWLLDSPPSEVDDDEYTGPPTPISEIDDYDESTTIPPPVVPAKVGSGVLEYDGMPCITTEWFGMVDDLARAQTLSRVWNKSWVSRTSDAHPAMTERKVSKKRKRQSDIPKSANSELSALATQVISNREFRLHLLERIPLGHHNTNHGESTTDFGSSGTTLIDFASPPSHDEDSFDTIDHEPSAGGAFKQCDIHLGFNGNAMRMSIASLRYWRELDLQPLGGKKDIKVIALVEGLDRMEAGKQICTRLGHTYRVGHSDCS